MARIDKFIETESRILVTRGWEKGDMGSYCLMFRVLVWDDKKVLEVDGGDNCTTMC